MVRTDTQQQKKNVWLIGASSGIGRELALGLARQGATVLASARSSEKLHSLQASAPGQIHPYPLDICDTKESKKVYERIRSEHGFIDVLIYNAGIYEPMDGGNFDLDYSLQVLDTNLSGLVRAVGNVLPAMVAARSGHIVGVASVVGYRGLPKAAAYGASKAGMINFLESLRFDLKKYGVAISIVNPGFVRTQLTSKNTFHMPFCIEPKEAAEAIRRGINSRDLEIHFPKAFTLFVKCMRVIPFSLYNFLVGRRAV